MPPDLALLRSDLRKKLKVKQSAISNRVSRIKKKRAMTDGDALGVLAREVGLPIDKKYAFTAEDLVRIGDHEIALSVTTAVPKKAMSPPSKTAVPAPSRTAIFDLHDFHPEVVKHSKTAFRSKLSSSAVQRAFQGFHNRVKKITKAPDHLDGESMLGWAFNPKSPQLQLNDLSTTTKRNEQEGLQRLAQGSYQGFRNPASHDIDWGPTEDHEVLELLSVASFLHRCVDRCLHNASKAGKRGTGT